MHFQVFCGCKSDLLYSATQVPRIPADLATTATRDAMLKFFDAKLRLRAPETPKLQARPPGLLGLLVVPDPT